MQLDFSQLKNKQRIFIGGNQGTDEIINIITFSLEALGKPFDVLRNGEGQITDAPLVLYNGMNDLNPDTGKAYFHALRPHIAIFHKIVEPVPDTYKSFEDFINQYEQLADELPKAGTFLYYQSDNVSLMIGKKERADVRNIEYTKLKTKREGDQLTIKFPSDNRLTFNISRKGFPGELSAALNIIERLAVKEKDFINSIQNFQPGA